jgi:hypothetical protein
MISVSDRGPSVVNLRAAVSSVCHDQDVCISLPSKLTDEGKAEILAFLRGVLVTLEMAWHEEDSNA